MLDFLWAHLADIAMLVYAVDLGARVVVKLTPSKADDDVLDQVEAALIKFGFDPSKAPPKV